MKQHLNTLFVTTQGAYVHCEGEAALIRIENETRVRVPIHMIGGVVCFGRVSCSPAFMGLCGERGVTITHLTEHGRFLARIEGPISGNVLLRKTQYRKSEEPGGASELARTIVRAKVANCRTALLRALRDHPDIPGAVAVAEATKRLSGTLERLERPQSLDSVRGLEGESARYYFEVFDHLILVQKEDFFFKTRNRRPPLDNMNSLLSFVYTLLTHDARSALESVGLDPAVGFLHRDRPGRPGLALDLVEEFRPVLGDRFILSLVNRRQLRPDGFRKSESGAVLMDDETRKAILSAYQERKQEAIIHPFLGEETTVGLLPHLQARLLAAFLRGDLDAYPPFVWR
jgi:CRISPR-associated protein Cas1